MNVSLLSLALLTAGAAQVETQEKRTTELYVRTIPPGAEVIVDGQRVGTSDGLFPVRPQRLYLRKSS